MFTDITIGENGAGGDCGEAGFKAATVRSSRGGSCSGHLSGGVGSPPLPVHRPVCPPKKQMKRKHAYFLVFEH